MFSISKVLVSAALILFVATAPSHAATVSWYGKDKNKVTFGKSVNGGGKSKLEVRAGAGSRKLGMDATPDSRVTFKYHNAVNKMRCFITCKPTPTKRKMFSVFDKGKLVSRVRVIVKSTPNPRGDVMYFRVKYLAEGFSWSNTGKFKVCETCDQFLQLTGSRVKPTKPVVTEVSAVPVPPTIALLSTIFAMFGLGKMKKRRKKPAQRVEYLSKNPPLFYTEKG